MHIYGPPRLEEMILDHLKFYQNDLGYDLVFHRIQNRRSALLYEDKNIEVHSLPMIHRVPATGFLFREKEKERTILKGKIDTYNIPVRNIPAIKRGEDFELPDGNIIPNSELTLPPPRPVSYAYCSDTSPNDKLIPLIKDVDLLYHETTFLHKDAKLANVTTHSTSKQAAEFAAKACAGRLLIGHFSSRYKRISDFESEAREIFNETFAVNDGDVFEVNN